MLFKAEVEGKPFKTEAFLKISPGPLKDGLTSSPPVDTSEQKLEKRHSLVRLYGTARKQGSRTIYLQVEFAEKLKDEDLQFKQRLSELGNDAAKIAALRAECLKRARRYDDGPLHDVARTIAHRELEVRKKDLKPGDYEGLYRLAVQYRDELKDPEGAIPLWAQVYEARDAPRALRLRAHKDLKAVGAVRTRNASGWEWLTEEDYKRKQGYISRSGKWIRKELAELNDHRNSELARQRRQFDPPRTKEHECEKAAKNGTVVRGQFFQEVARAIGLPVTVRHLRAKSHDDKVVTWSQWLMSDGRRIYFVRSEKDPAGTVISWTKAGTPWPVR